MKKDLLFTSNSWLVASIEAFTFILFALHFWHTKDESFSLTHFILFFLLLLFLFQRFCFSKKWYPQVLQKRGIENHFDHAFLICLYSLFFGLLTSLLFSSVIGMMFSLTIVSIFSFINGIMITFFFQDKDKTPVNYYSSSKPL